jgi:hypothetical protein
MAHRCPLRPGGLLLAAALLATSPAASDAQEPREWLADSAALARVNGKPIRVKDFVYAWFNAYAEYRPMPDSAGRVKFLNSMVDKEVLALAAKRANRPLGFEDRLRIRRDTETMLSNTLLQRAVFDSATVTEDEIRKLYEAHRHEQHFRQILFADRETAERVRADLMARRIRWDDAARRYHRAERDSARGGSDLGWTQRGSVDPGVADRIFGLAPGELSGVIQDRSGWRIVQSVARRPAQVAPYAALRRSLRGQLMAERRAQLARRLQTYVGARIGLVYDTTNVQWAAAQFGRRREMRNDGGEPTIEINAAMPAIGDADTGRVLARHRDGRYTMAAFLHDYHQMNPLARPEVGDFEALRGQIDAFVLTPHMAQVAVERGLDRDSLTVATLEMRREAMMVEHLYEDSIATRVVVTPGERRKYYDDRVAQFHTYARVRFAALVRASRASAESLAAALRSGADAAGILHADSLRGEVSGSIQERSENEQGAPYHKILFQELREGQATVVGPDRKGEFAILQVLEHDPGRQLSYEESADMADEAVRTFKAEEMLNAFLERERRRHRIEWFPGQVMRVRLVEATPLD